MTAISATFFAVTFKAAVIAVIHMRTPGYLFVLVPRFTHPRAWQGDWYGAVMTADILSHLQ